jgi:hypothetical protein
MLVSRTGGSSHRKVKTEAPKNQDESERSPPAFKKLFDGGEELGRFHNPPLKSSERQKAKLKARSLRV